MPIVRVPGADGPTVDLSFVTVTYGTGPVVVDAIASLVAAMDEGLIFEVVVVDNEHAEAASRSRNELALSTAGVRLLRPGRNLGFGGGCELGALHARGQTLAFVNPDLLARTGWIRPLLDRLADGPSIVAPTLLNLDGSVQEAGRVLFADGSTQALTDLDAVRASDARPPDYASAACWLIRRDEHERLGGFDAAFHPAFYEDVELAMRAARLGDGIEVSADVAVFHHHGQGTLGGSRMSDTSVQRDVLLSRYPDIRWRQPVPPCN